MTWDELILKENTVYQEFEKYGRNSNSSDNGVRWLLPGGS